MDFGISVRVFRTVRQYLYRLGLHAKKLRKRRHTVLEVYTDRVFRVGGILGGSNKAKSTRLPPFTRHS